MNALQLHTRLGRLALTAILLAFSAGVALAAEQSPGLEMLLAQSKARAAVVKTISPSVVHIAVEKTVQGQAHGDAPDMFDDEFFRRFFQPRMPSQPREFHQRGLGSGSIVDRKGLILTNNHVVESADKITVKLPDGRELPAKLIGADPATDLAVVKVDGDNLPVATLGNSDDLEVGESVIAIGNPFGLEQTVTAGIVSAKGRSQVGLTDYEDFIQTDASINPGNSGGPLVNLKGEIVGVNTAIYSRSGGNQGIGFAIPINMARSIMKDLIASGKVTRGFLGVVIQDVTQELASALGVDVNGGVLISNVGRDTPAAEAGVRQGDLIVSFNNRPTKSSNALRNAVAAIKPGTAVPVEVLREGKKMQFKVTVREQPEDMRAAIGGSGGERPGRGTPVPPQPESVLGMELQALTDDVGEQLGYKGLTGVLVSQVAPNSPAADAGLQRGALIMEVNQRPVRTVAEFLAAVKNVKPGQHILLLVRLGDFNRFLGIKKP
ncbi:MAG: DegQ family serine endoprotease [Candidatus Lambdaproteobacteria bacterium]|nr:DegQ family serine endoprotease [Candidatus Lambdaproteobacteria bacterium]